MVVLNSRHICNAFGYSALYHFWDTSGRSFQFHVCNQDFVRRVLWDNCNVILLESACVTAYVCAILVRWRYAVGVVHVHLFHTGFGTRGWYLVFKINLILSVYE